MHVSFALIAKPVLTLLCVLEAIVTYHVSSESLFCNCLCELISEYLLVF